jgi:hypothetical protein
MVLQNSDREILRDLAKRQLFLANEPRNRRLEQQWRLHGAWHNKTPMVHLELGTFVHEVIPPLLRCEDAAAREIETRLYSHFANQEILGDDRVIPDYFPIYWRPWFHVFGHIEKIIYAQNSEGSSVGHQFVHLIDELDEDFHKLKPSAYGIDRDADLMEEKFFLDLLGDILPVRRVMDTLYAVPAQHVVHLMGMEKMFFAFHDYPDLFKEMMNRIAADYTAYFRWLEAEGLLLPTTDCQHLNQGSYCYTNELPSETPGVRTRLSDVWGYLDAQETVGISQAQYDEFFFPYYERIASLFGLLSYGCCEPVHFFWENFISKLPNLRKVSISAWCDEMYMGEQLRGRHIVYLRKPSPNYLGVSKTLDEDAIRLHFRETLTAARGCFVEIAQRDVYTIHNDIAKARRYLELIRQTIESYWKD